MDLFRPDAPWPTVARQTRVFKIGPGFASQGREEDLRQLFANLRERHIALALEIGMLSISDHCREKTEAYGEPGLVEHILLRIKRLGGNLDYLAMDEPFYYGHQYAGPDACKLPAAQLAQDIAPNIVTARRIFPGVKIGDVEVVYYSTDFVDATQEWVDAFAKSTGTPLAFFHADESWSPQAMRNLVPLAGFLKRRHVRFGVIYNAGPQGTSDASWAQAAIRHADAAETELGLHPDDALFQTWEKFPTRVLPETASDTLTHIALRYLQPRTSLTSRRDGTQLVGRLIDLDGAPVANVAILFSTIGDTQDDATVQQRISGRVPASAHAAVLAIRANRELNCATCAGAVTARLGSALYSEGSDNVRRFPPSRVDVTAVQSVATNSPQFPVQPGASFTFEIPLAVSTQAERAGSVGVLFVDAAGHEVQRRMISLEPTELILGAAQTDADGRFSYTLSNTFAGGAKPTIRARFTGNERLRGASVLLPPQG
ncbi:hypothetical protein D7S89_22495 [Trinickia fusca]|uniref:Uncharacterized protein n=2 Tax=Trinickia fusca TaxID=2419777 RepID=A0A494X1S0_9BURK|nr:hypothetical protein D7S89_22495 [Trinickia fusca]